MYSNAKQLKGEIVVSIKLKIAFLYKVRNLHFANKISNRRYDFFLNGTSTMIKI